MGTATLRAAVYGRESQAKVRSIEDQVDLGTEVVADHGWTPAGIYSDKVSASRYGTKSRGGWKVLLDALHAQAFDVLVLWEASRGSRQLGEWTALLDACRDGGVLIHLVGDDRTYDPRRASDRRMLASAGVEAEYETGRLSERAQRGVNKALRKGRPPMGKTPYGYRRTYDPDTGDLIGQEPDPTTAPDIARMFERCAEGAKITTIADELGWTRRLVLHRLRNPAYAGLRRHRMQGRNGDGRGQLHSAAHDGIVSAELYWDVQGILDGHRGAGRRPSRQKHLLSGIATCARCKAGLTVRAGHYRCQPGHVQIDKADLDELVEAAIGEALASDDLYETLRQTHEQSSVEAQQARDHAATLTARLKDYRQRMRRGTMDPDDFADIAQGLRADIAAAEDRAKRAAVPPALRRFLEPGADVQARWDDAELLAKRDVIRALARVVVHPVGNVGSRGVPVADRVSVTPRQVG